MDLAIDNVSSAIIGVPFSGLSPEGKIGVLTLVATIVIGFIGLLIASKQKPSMVNANLQEPSIPLRKPFIGPIDANATIHGYTGNGMEMVTLETDTPRIAITWPKDNARNVSRKLQTFAVAFSTEMAHGWSISGNEYFRLGKSEVTHEDRSPIFIFRRERYNDLLPPRTEIKLTINPSDHGLNFRSLTGVPAPNDVTISFMTGE